MTAVALRTAQTTRAIATAIFAIAARITLGLIYSLTLLLCRLSPRARRWPTGFPSCAAVTGTFYNLGWFRAHMVPLVRSGLHRVIVVSDRPVQDLPDLRTSCPPRWLMSVSGRALAKFIWLMITAIRYQPDLFIGFHIFPGAVGALIAARLFRRPACYQMTGGPVEVLGGGWRAENPLMARLARPSPLVEHLVIAVIRQFDLVVVRGTKAQAFLARHGIRESVAVITGSIAQPAKATKVEPLYDLVFIGRLTEIKRPLMFIELAARVKRQFPSLRSAVVGSGPLLLAMRDRVGELGIYDSIEFCGQREDVSDIIARSKVFVLTSRSEGFSIAMAEAMDAGAVPVVADVGELSDLVVNGENGYVVSPDDLEEYVERILLLLRDSSVFDRLSTCAARTARSRAGVDVVAGHWADHLVDLGRRLRHRYEVAPAGKRRHTLADPPGARADRHST
jgi:glycosyltransferase involved in cell wall biosynthesis